MVSWVRSSTFRAAAVRMAGTLLAALAPFATSSLAQEIVVSRLEQYTENRGWNEAGVGPTYQIIVAASVAPSGYPTLVFAERGDLRQPLTHFANPLAPDLYVLWLRFEQASTASWRIVAERGEIRSTPALTPALAKPWQVPLVNNVRATGRGAQPRVSWTLPDLAGRNVERIRVAIRGGQRLHGRFLSVLFVSTDLPPTATDYTIPAAILASGERYIFQVMLENLEGGELKNRSLTFSEPYTVLHQ